MNSVKIQTILFCSVSLLLGLAIGFMFAKQQTVVPSTSWVTYTDPAGRFSFSHPKEVSVNCREESCTLTSPTVNIPDPVPDMTIKMDLTSVQFATWENFDVDYFEELVSSFQFE